MSGGHWEAYLQRLKEAETQDEESDADDSIHGIRYTGAKPKTASARASAISGVTQDRINDGGEYITVHTKDGKEIDFTNWDDVERFEHQQLYKEKGTLSVDITANIPNQNLIDERKGPQRSRNVQPMKKGMAEDEQEEHLKRIGLKKGMAEDEEQEDEWNASEDAEQWNTYQQDEGITQEDQQVEPQQEPQQEQYYDDTSQSVGGDTQIPGGGGGTGQTSSQGKSTMQEVPPQKKRSPSGGGSRPSSRKPQVDESAEGLYESKNKTEQMASDAGVTVEDRGHYMIVDGKRFSSWRDAEAYMADNYGPGAQRRADNKQQQEFEARRWEVETEARDNVERDLGSVGYTAAVNKNQEVVLTSNKDGTKLSFDSWQQAEDYVNQIPRKQPTVEPQGVFGGYPTDSGTQAAPITKAYDDNEDYQEEDFYEDQNYEEDIRREEEQYEEQQEREQEQYEQEQEREEEQYSQDLEREEAREKEESVEGAANELGGYLTQEGDKIKFSYANGFGYTFNSIDEARQYLMGAVADYRKNQAQTERQNELSPQASRIRSLWNQFMDLRNRNDPRAQEVYNQWLEENSSYRGKQYADSDSGSEPMTKSLKKDAGSSYADGHQNPGQPLGLEMQDQSSVPGQQEPSEEELASQPHLWYPNPIQPPMIPPNDPEYKVSEAEAKASIESKLQEIGGTIKGAVPGFQIYLPENYDPYKSPPFASWQQARDWLGSEEQAKQEIVMRESHRQLSYHEWRQKRRLTEGGEGSGNFDHAGRPGEIGGSSPRSGHQDGGTVSRKTSRTGEPGPRPASTSEGKSSKASASGKDVGDYLPAWHGGIYGGLMRQYILGRPKKPAEYPKYTDLTDAQQANLETMIENQDALLYAGGQITDLLPASFADKVLRPAARKVAEGIDYMTYDPDGRKIQDYVNFGTYVLGIGARGRYKDQVLDQVFAEGHSMKNLIQDEYGKNFIDRTTGEVVNNPAIRQHALPRWLFPKTETGRFLSYIFNPWSIAANVGSSLFMAHVLPAFSSQLKKYAEGDPRAFNLFLDRYLKRAKGEEPADPTAMQESLWWGRCAETKTPQAALAAINETLQDEHGVIPEVLGPMITDAVFRAMADLGSEDIGMVMPLMGYLGEENIRSIAEEGKASKTDTAGFPIVSLQAQKALKMSDDQRERLTPIAMLVATLGGLYTAWPTLSETLDDKEHINESEDSVTPEGSQSYLIVGDPKVKSTWHLPVKHGKTPDHNLMGAAFAALVGAGHRGNKYEGPGKQEAIRKLRALYASEKMPWPGDKDDKE